MGGRGGMVRDEKQPAVEAALAPEAIDEVGRGGASVESTATSVPEAKSSGLLEQVLSRENLQRALKRVVGNAGAPGVDGCTVEELQRRLVHEWPGIRAALLSGTYVPSPVRQVLIPKPSGGERQLGIPTALDRLIQQALLQVLQPDWDPTFADASYGFRPGRSAHQAVERARGYVAAGRAVVVDVDLEAFFDRVNHDVLMSRVMKRVADRRVVKLIRSYLTAGIMAGGLVSARTEGTPQGGPLSPLLSNLLLDELDRELEKRGHCFVRYADDCNVYVRSQRAGERVMAQMTRLLERMRLKVNTAKSAVAPVAERQFLGFQLVAEADGARALIAPKAQQRMQQRVRELTAKRGHRNVEQVIAELSPYLRGWAGYFRFAEERWFWRNTFSWISRRLRMLQLVHWKTADRIYRQSRRLGAREDMAKAASNHGRRWWRTAGKAMNAVISTKQLLAWGLYDLRIHTR
jgi:RNA-directed DNA polymerase